MQDLRGQSLAADDVVGELMPGELDWKHLVRKYPIPALVVAGVGGYLLGRSRGREIALGLSTFAADSVNSHVNELLGQDVL